MSTDNLAARAGRWSARHRRTAVLGWLAFVIAAAVGGGSIGLNTFVRQENGPGESGRADQAIYDAFPYSAGGQQGHLEGLLGFESTGMITSWLPLFPIVIRSTAGVVTSAAVVMVGVFAIFATLTALEFKQMGVGLAVAIVIDATIVRGVLLPAYMKLLGDWNWYFPKRLAWLPTAAPEQQLGATRV